MFKTIQSFFITIILLSFFVAGCDTEKKEEKKATLFSLLTPEQTHIDFSNTLTEGLNTNVLMYEYFYNGGGVGIGDVNGDGLQDIYFTGNMVTNKLYLNKGKMQFSDITDAAAVAGRPGPWKTGVTMVDINGDNKLDIYVCYSGKLSGVKRANQLFINDGNAADGVPHFSEQASTYGIADTAYSTQAYFFDFDKDGDLDMFLLNHNPNSLPVLDEASTAALIGKTNPAVGIRLYRNDKNHFNDITAGSGISSSSLSYGLGAGIADINNDGWQDVYVSNDYTIPDYLYINNHDGTFSNQLQTSVGHITQFSMGNSVSDINNDGLPDIFTLDMLPEDNHRQKLLFAPDNYEKFALTVTTGFYYQYMRNMLQLNNGDGSFSEIGQLAGISNTDWSWAPLFADYDNDGWKDLFVTNGYARDYTNMDFLKYYGDYMQTKGRFKREDVLELVRKIPSSDVPKYIFRNNANLTFSNKADDWGFTKRSNGNGAAYADLDNDGDLDLVENNINEPAFIYENQADKQPANHYLQVKLSGEGMNSQGIGSKVIVYAGSTRQFLEQMPSSGYESTVTSILHFGIGNNDHIDSLRINWLGGKWQVINNVKANQVIELKEADANKNYSIPKHVQSFFTEVKSPLNYQHEQGAFYDFKKQPLLINPLSFSGPCMVKGDINKDGLDDVFMGGGGIGKAGALYIQNKEGQFKLINVPVFDTDKRSQDADAAFFDANADGFIDLYVASGGYYTYKPEDSLLQDRLYLNDGKGSFFKATNALPSMLASKSCVRVTDINHDSYPDLFIGGRVIPGRYPETPQSYLLINDGKGHFTDRTSELAPALQKTGMVTDAAWIDLNGDKADDLVVSGEWMPLSVFINQDGKLENKTAQYFDKSYSGWWNKLLIHDFNGDGKPDIVAGNQGLNTQCKVSDKEPAEMYFKDFDDNGAVDPFLCFYIQGKSYPYVTRDELLDQISSMRTRFSDYKSYADITIQDLFPDDLKTAGHLQANELATSYFEMGADNKFHIKQLPVQVQFSPVFSMLPVDFDKDGKDDLVLGGNIHNARIRFGNCDANYGLLLKGDGKGNFEYIDQEKTGFHIIGDVRSIQLINHKILFGINGGQVKAFEYK